MQLSCLLVLPPGGAPGLAGFDVCWSGDEGEADRVLAPIRRLGTPAVDSIAPMDYVALQRSGDITDPRAQGQYLKAGFIPELPPGLVSAIVDGFAGNPTPTTIMAFQPGGGAIGRVPVGATAVADMTAATIRENYRQNHDRLVQVKNRYDPTNLFRLNANIAPSV